MIIDHQVGAIYQQDNQYLTGMRTIVFSVVGISEVSIIKDWWETQPATGTWNSPQASVDSWGASQPASGGWVKQGGA